VADNVVITSYLSR